MLLTAHFHHSLFSCVSLGLQSAALLSFDEFEIVYNSSKKVIQTN